MKESKLITSIKFGEPIQAVDFKIQDYLDSYHRQDCCEHVYIDFEHIDAQVDAIKNLGSILYMDIMTAPGDGILVNLYNSEEKVFGPGGVSVFLACRNEQNGFYNDDLELVVTKRFDLQKLGCVENKISSLY